MKNYLFPSFNNDDDKIEEFNAVVNALKYVLADVNPSLTDADRNHYLESALHGLRVFIGRLESYYDAIISKLQADNKSFHGQYDEIERLISVNTELSSKLQAVNDDYNNDHKVHNEYEDGLLAEIKKLKADKVKRYNINNDNVNELKAENKRLKNGFGHGVLVELEQVDALKEQVNDLMIDKDRLMKQVSSNRDSNSNTIQREIDEYMSHNDKCKGARMFILPIEAFKGGYLAFDCIDYDDGIEA